MWIERVRVAVLISSIMVVSFIGWSQPPTRVIGKHPTIGQPIPDITFPQIDDFKLKSASMKDFRGQWLVLSFWSPGCLTSVNSLSEYNQYQQTFRDSITWLMLGLKRGEHAAYIKDFYQKLKKTRKLKLPMTYVNSLADDWDIPNVPHNIIVDPTGVVAYITDQRDLSMENIRKLISGKPVNFYNKMLDRNQPRFDPMVPPPHNAVANNVLQHTMLVKYNGELSRTTATIDQWLKLPQEEKQKGYSVVGAPLYWLYNHAYRGKSYWAAADKGYSDEYLMPILEVRDSSLFQHDRIKGRYTYSLIMPVEKMTEENIMKTMQTDLIRTFGIEGQLEVRKMPVWKLIAQPGAVDKLKSTGGKRFYTRGNHMFGFTMQNIEPVHLISAVSFALMRQYMDPWIPFIDDTGLTSNFDLTMNADMSDLESVRKELRKMGLDLVKGFKDMRVLVLHDAQQKLNE